MSGDGGDSVGGEVIVLIVCGVGGDGDVSGNGGGDVVVSVVMVM